MKTSTATVELAPRGWQTKKVAFVGGVMYSLRDDQSWRYETGAQVWLQFYEPDEGAQLHWANILPEGSSLIPKTEIMSPASPPVHATIGPEGGMGTTQTQDADSDSHRLLLETWSVMYVRRHLTSRAELGDPNARLILHKITAETELSKAQLEYLKNEIAACAEKEGDVVGPAIRILSQLSDI